VLILLPPSEGKTAPQRGRPLDLATLSEPLLTAPREQVLAALITLCSKQPKKAATILGLGPRQLGEVAANAQLRSAPSAPAIEIYTGVLFEALDAPTLSAAQRQRLNGAIRIASALFGLVTPRDAIPAYRLSGDVKLPGIASLADVWHAPIGAILEAESGPILDLRSGTYAKLAPAPAGALVGRVLLERNGKRSVVSHHNKATKGRLVRGLVKRRAMPRSDDALLQALHDLGYRCEVHAAKRADQPATLDIIVTDV